MARSERIIENLHIGPAGWSYKDWIGPVYPPGKRTDQLLTIASYFDCIELNSSFYRVPSEKLTRSWAQRLSDNPDFRFTVKVWQRFTHEMKCDRNEFDYFIHSFDPLIEEERIGGFLLQFPWSFKYEHENREHLERLGKLFSTYPTAVEFRHGSWNLAEALRLISNSGFAFCNIDQPVIGNSIPPTEHVTDTRLGYIRLHGRNRKNWFRQEAGRDERYDYLYSDHELEDWKKRAKRILESVKDLFIITNNHYRGQALVNAFQLRSILEKRRLEIPPSLTAAFPGLRRIAVLPPSQGELLNGL